MLLNQNYIDKGEFLNFKSKFQMFRRILFCTSNLSRKYFIKKDHIKYMEKMNFLFERAFFYLKEWFKYSNYYISESGNPELQIVKDLKENLLPLSFSERKFLFYQKPKENQETKNEAFKLNCKIY